jgi:hypothetical protein
MREQRSWCEKARMMVEESAGHATRARAMV